ncbi:hypothetical protein [Nitratireductor pacificus]|uniref:hypothetical protein n=1 Tax=Nitratireductor pacificus TaxID=1231180 RepID=UPI0012F688B6|nr:hypothetical protein [Nitratireductor pacificus]
MDALPGKPALGAVELAEQGKREFSQKQARWAETLKVEDAEELVAAAIVSGVTTNEVCRAAAAILKDPAAQSGSRRLAQGILEPLPQDAPRPALVTRAEIQQLKRLVVKSPHDALRVAELSRLYTLLGQRKPAIVAMRRALALADTNRYVLRSAVRLLIHVGREDEAAALIADHGLTERDPWLMAAAVGAAQAAGHGGRLMRAASRMVMSDNHSAFSLSELRASLATEHLNAGEIKLARRQFRLSLKAPTENALAQAKWAQGVDKAIEISSDLMGRPEAHEAHALDTARIGHWERSLVATGEWKADERFSGKPFVHASWISTGPLNSPADALPWLQEGLVANPDDPSLLNNLAVAKAMLGDLDRADDALTRARKNAEDDAFPLILAATEGLIAFRRGDPISGAALYQQALSTCVEKRLPHQWLRVAAYLARELAAIDFRYAKATLDQIEIVETEMRKRGHTISQEISAVTNSVRDSTEKEVTDNEWNWDLSILSKLRDSLLLN